MDDEDGQANDGQQSRWIIWTFCCVYDSKGIGEECVKSFLTKMVYVTEALRSMPWWREGTALSAQHVATANGSFDAARSHIHAESVRG